MAHIGLFLALVWSVADLIQRAHAPRLAAVVTGAVLLACVLLTWRQIGYWRDSFTIWEQTLRVTTDNARALNNYGEALWQEKRFLDAFQQYDAYVKLRPNEVRGYRHRGNTLFERYTRKPAESSLLERAVEDYQTALGIDRNLPDVQLSLGVIRLDYLAPRAAHPESDRLLAEAAKNFQAALDGDADVVKVKAWYNLGRTCLVQKFYAKADDCFVEVLRHHPEDMGVQILRTDALAGAGRFAEAIAVVDKLLRQVSIAYQPELAQDLEYRRQSFEKGQPYRSE